MAKYWINTPFWLKKLHPGHLLWEMPRHENSVYITFDDGPHPTATDFALRELGKYNAHATFFCVGQNAEKHPDLIDRIVKEGHATGNHTHHHLNGWKTDKAKYIDDITAAAHFIPGRLFRPPYGRIRLSQIRRLRRQDRSWKIIMWSLLSADFDAEITPDQCLQNVLGQIRPGSIIIFHDSTKAWDRMSYALPRVLAYCREHNWEMKHLAN